METMERSKNNFNVKTLNHMGKKIIFTDFTTCKSQKQIWSMMNEAKSILLTHPEIQSSVSDVSGVPIGSEVLREWKKMTKEVLNKRLTKTAVIGMHGLKTILFHSIASITTNEIKTFNTKEESLSWLAN